MGRKAKLVAIGAFDPPTFAHLRMFERAREYLEKQHEYEIVEGIISLIPDTFRNKNCKASHQHRMAMLKRILRNNRWIRPDDWQCSQSPQFCLPQVLSYLDSTFNVDRDGTRISTVFLCNDQFFEHVSVDEFDYCTTLEFHQVICNFDTVVVCTQRFGSFTSPSTTVTLTENKTKLCIVHDYVYFGPNSGKNVRKALEEGDSIKYCTDNSVIAYIYEHGLYCRQCPPLPLKKKPVEICNPWELLQKETDLMSCSLPSAFLEEHLFPSDQKPSANSHQNLFRGSEVVSPSRGQPPPSIPKKLSTKPQNHWSDPSVYKLSKTVDSSLNNSIRACSTICFTFEQHNLTYTPESTV